MTIRRFSNKPLTVDDLVIFKALAPAMALVLESFGRDVLWLWDNRPSGPLRRVHNPAGTEPHDRAG